MPDMPIMPSRSKRTPEQRDALARYTHDEIGRRLAADGKFYTPWVEENDAWIERTDIEWAETQNPGVDVEKDRKAKHSAEVKKHRNLASKWKDKKKGRKFTANGVNILLLSPITLTDDDALEVCVLATNASGDLLFVDDGWFRIWNPPVETEDGFLGIITAHIARTNGMM